MAACDDLGVAQTTSRPDNAAGLTAGQPSWPNKESTTESTMNRQVSLALGMCCLIATAVLGYVAFDSYQAEVNKGQAARDKVATARGILVEGGPVDRFLSGVNKDLEP